MYCDDECISIMIVLRTIVNEDTFAENGHAAVVEELIKAGADVNAVDYVS